MARHLHFVVNGKEYRIIVQGISVGSPMGTTVALYDRDIEIWNHLLAPDEKESEIVAQAEEVARRR